MPRPRIKKLPSSTELREHLRIASAEVDVSEIAIERMVLAFLDRCSEERQEIKPQVEREAIEAGKVDKDGHYYSSPYVLSYRIHKGSLELYWMERLYRRGKLRPEKEWRREPMPGGKTDMVPICAKAAPAEAALLRRHEGEARELRLLWKAYLKVRTSLRFFHGDLAE